MKDQKNIERLFQEKFKDFEVMPPKMAWQNIEANLNKKEKKRRVIPIWFKTTGIAASLILGLYLIMNYNNSNIIESEINTVEKNSNNSSFIKNLKNDKPNKDSELIFVPNNGVVTDNEKLIEEEGIEYKPFQIKKESKNLKTLTKESNRIASKNKTEQGPGFFNKREVSELQNVLANNIQTTNLEKISQENNSNITLVDTETMSDKNNVLTQVKNNSNRSVVILEKSNANITQDSSIVANILEEVNTLEQLLKEKEVGKNAEEKEKEGKWGVSSNAAPVYFNSTTNGSPIDTQFAENNKSYVSTLSYGVGFSYDISKKLSLRAGINSLALEYNTNDVLYASSLKQAPDGETMLSRNANGENIIFLSKTSNNILSGDVDNFTQNNKGIINQTTSYIEIPLEMSYKLIDNKFGIEVIGGMSSLFLNNNTISLLSNGMEMNIGEATNLNKVHFSSNVGFGFKYTFLKSIDINLNPMFKYQLNTYTDNAGNFKPYFIGLYSGLSYKF